MIANKPLSVVVAATSMKPASLSLTATVAIQLAGYRPLYE